jgi:putative thioredoxin
MNEPVILTITSAQDLEQAIVTLEDDELLIIDFWAEWCGPCKSLTPVLEQIAAKYAPKVKLAKINVDENQVLASQFKVQSIPAVKFVHKGRIVQQFVGAQTADAVEKMVKAVLPHSEEEKSVLDEMKAALAGAEWHRAERLLQQLVQSDPENTDYPLLLAKCSIALGDYDEARILLGSIDQPSRLSEKENLQLLLNIFETCTRDTGELERQVAENPQDLEAVYQWACALAASGDMPAAFEALLGIIRTDRKFREGEPRKLMVALFDLAGSASPLAQEYRKRLTNILFV